MIAVSTNPFEVQRHYSSLAT